MNNRTVALGAILFVIFQISVFANGTQEADISGIDLVQRIIEFGGLDDRLTNTDLAILPRDDLQLLRNAVYARHGMIFQSNNLTQYFQKYSWYRPVNRNVESRLSEIDRDNIRNIETFENARPNPGLSKNQLAGKWINSFPAPSYCGEMSINNNNTFEINDPLFEGRYRGRYTIENGFLIVILTDQYNADSNRWVSSQPFRLAFPILDLQEFYEGYCYRVRIGYTWWFGGPDLNPIVDTPG